MVSVALLRWRTYYLKKNRDLRATWRRRVAHTRSNLFGLCNKFRCTSRANKLICAHFFAVGGQIPFGPLFLPRKNKIGVFFLATGLFSRENAYFEVIFGQWGSDFSRQPCKTRISKWVSGVYWRYCQGICLRRPLRGERPQAAQHVFPPYFIPCYLHRGLLFFSQTPDREHGEFVGLSAAFVAADFQ